MNIYTDGACSQNGTWKGGWAAVIVLPEDEKPVVKSGESPLISISGSEEKTTNNRMELLSVIKAIEVTFSVSSNKKKNIRIHSDSSYVVKGITEYLPKWKRRGYRNAKGETIANLDLWEKIEYLLERLGADKSRLEMIKVKGHSGDKYNELADKLATSEVR